MVRLHVYPLFCEAGPERCQEDKAAGLKEKALMLLEVIKENPYQNPPPYDKLVGDLQGAYSRRINIQHRLIYQVEEELKAVKIIRLWTHYE